MRTATLNRLREISGSPAGMAEACRAGWYNQAYDSLVEVLGTAALGSVLLDIASSLTGADEIFGYWISGEDAPAPLVSCGHRGSSASRASLYAGGFHRLDPINRLLRQQGPQSSIGMASFRSRDIADQSYRSRCFDHPGLVEKVAFFRSWGTRHYVFALYRTDGEFEQSERMTALAELALPLLRRHGELIGEELGMPLIQRLEWRIARHYPMMTQREREVCARTLAGMTAEATAISLGIGKTSVLTYRQRAYDRYGISSAGQLIENLLG